MTVIFVLICAAVSALLIVLFCLLKGRRGEAGPKGPGKYVPRQPVQKASSVVTRPSEADESGLKVILESYPILKEIPYTPAHEGLHPLLPDEISESVRKVVDEKMSAFKPIHANSVKLLNLLKNPESNPGEITTIVSTNPVFSARVLRSVNSVYYGLPEKIGSVGRAITLLGYNNVRSLVLEDTLQNVIPTDRRGGAEAYVKIWVHSAIVSVCAGYLGKRFFRLSEYDCATMGLLHDIGKYFIHGLGQSKDEDSDLPLVAREEKSFGISHSALGALVAEKWGLSNMVSGVIGYHHHPSFVPLHDIPEEYRKHCFVVCLADLMGKLLDRDFLRGDEVLPVKPEYYDFFGMTDDLTKIVTPLLINEVEKARLTVDAYVSVTRTNA
jgi:HD-like signal output (HDOD) protein